MTAAAAALVPIGKLTVNLKIRERLSIGRRNATNRRHTVGSHTQRLCNFHVPLSPNHLSFLPFLAFSRAFLSFGRFPLALWRTFGYLTHRFVTFSNGNSNHNGLIHAFNLHLGHYDRCFSWRLALVRADKFSPHSD